MKLKDFTSHFQNLLLRYTYQYSVILVLDIGINQRNRIERGERNPYIYSQLIFLQDAKVTYWGMDSLFNKCCRIIRYPHAKR